MKARRRIWLGAALVLTAACLSDETRHTLYLDPDGAVTWTVTQGEVRWEGKDAAEKSREERAFLDAVRRGEHDVAKGLDSLGPLWTNTVVVRDRSPYTVVTEARFASVADAFGAFLEGLGLDARAALRYDGTNTTLTFGWTEPSSDSGKGSQPAEALLADAERYRFVLTAGRFIEAVGFRIESDGRAAVLLDPEDTFADESPRYVLRWTSEEAPDAG